MVSNVHIWFVGGRTSHGEPRWFSLSVCQACPMFLISFSGSEGALPEIINGVLGLLHSMSCGVFVITRSECS